jgi:flagellar protein FliT
MDAQLTIFESMGHLSRDMVAAAQANDWDRLSALESEVARFRDQLMSRPTETVRSEDVRSRKIALIRHMLADDREVRAHAEPWMEDLKALLSGQSRQKAVQNAYGVGSR